MKIRLEVKTIRGGAGGLEQVGRSFSRLRSLASCWEADLFDSVMPFWLDHSIDHVHGGYFTCLDHDGSEV